MLSYFTRYGYVTRRAGWFRASCYVGMLGCVCALVGSFSPVVQAQEARTVDDGVYTAEQAERGQALYMAQCRVCHGNSLGGGLGPPLAGDTFIGLWSSLSLSELVTKIQSTMPENAPGELTLEEAASLVSYMLETNEFPAGTAELSDDQAQLSQITWPADTLADQSATAGLGTPGFPPVGNLAQVMRGMLFPSSNILFNVQSEDPGAERPVYQAGAENFSWADWGAGIYSGWQVADYAAIALAESSPLFLTPGRLCENGQPVPVDEEDWIRLTEEMVEVGKAAYRATQTRDQETVSEFTGALADACFNCHRVYRDKGFGPPEDPSNKAARCVP